MTGAAAIAVESGFGDADRARVARLYWQAFADKLGWVMGPEARALDFIETVLSPDHALVARDGGVVVGVAGFKTAHGALLAAICDAAASRGYAEVRLDVIDGNARARALYEREGFRPVARSSIGALRHVFGFTHATTMVRPVGTAAPARIRPAG